MYCSGGDGALSSSAVVGHSGSSLRIWLSKTRRSAVVGPSRWTSLLLWFGWAGLSMMVATMTRGTGGPAMANAFEVVRPVVGVLTARTGTSASFATRGRRLSSSVDDAPSNDGETDGNDGPPSLVDRAVVAQWRVSKLKSELDQLGAEYSDCFDKESLVERFMQARTNQDVRLSSDQEVVAGSQAQRPPPQQPQRPPPPTDETTTATTDLLEAVQSLSVRELKTELAARNIRWAGLLEKKDLVQALINARQTAALFSATGLLSPGQVTDLTADQMEQEVQWQSSSSSLLLVDVYATWCGPCQLMASILKEAALELPHVRFAKLDSDRYPELSGQWRVQGLPTILLFDGSREVARREGALPKIELVSWVREHCAAVP